MASNSRYQRNSPTLGNCADLDAESRQDGYIISWDETSGQYEHVQQGADPVVDARIANLETRHARITRFESIGTNTSGTLTIPTNETVVLDDFGGTVDAIVTHLIAGKPDWTPVVDTNGTLVYTSFDTNGSFALSAAASTTNNCVVFRTQVEAKNLVYDAGVIGPYSMDPAHTQLTLLNSDSNYQHITTTQVNNLHLPASSGTTTNDVVQLAVSTNQTLTTSFATSNLVLSHGNLVASNNNSDTNYVHLTGAEKTKLTSINDQLRGPTGFLAQDAVAMSYDSNTLKFTVSATTGAVFKGVTIADMTNGWVSAAHSTNNGTHFHYFDGTNYVWGTNGFVTFDNVMIGIVYKDATVTFGLTETHGCAMDSDDHRNQHFGVGTQRYDGGSLSQLVVNSYTAADRRPYVDQTRVLDEDKLTTLPALGTNSYTQVWLTGNVAGTNEGTLTWATSAADMVNLTTTRPNVNILTSGTGVLTPLSAGQFMSVWLLAVPVTTDANSQQFRYIWVQGQTQTTTSAAQLSIDSRTLDTRKLSRAIPESVFIGQVVLEYVGGGTANWRINTSRLITGSRVNQISVSGISGLSSVNSDSNYFTGLGTPASPLGITSNVATASYATSVAITNAIIFGG